MSRRNGDRSRFHIDRKRKLRHRRRIRALLTTLAQRRPGPEDADRDGPAAKPPNE